MDQQAEVIKNQMADTRSALGEKLEALEGQVSSTVKETSEAVAGTVAAVKETVETTVNSVTDSVQAVKDTFDVSIYADRYPWLFFGGCVAVGYTLGCLLSSGRSEAKEARRQPRREPEPSARTKAKPEAATSFMDSWAPVVKQLKGMAIGTTAGVLGEMALAATPASLKEGVTEMVDDVTRSFGGTVLRRKTEPAPNQGTNAS